MFRYCRGHERDRDLGVERLMSLFDLLLGLLNDMFFAAIPAVGFALVFNVPQKALIYCAVGGAIGHGGRPRDARAAGPTRRAYR